MKGVPNHSHLNALIAAHRAGVWGAHWAIGRVDASGRARTTDSSSTRWRS